MLNASLETPKKRGDTIAPPPPVRALPFLRLPAHFGDNRDFPLYTEKSNVCVIATEADDALLEHVRALNESLIQIVNKVIFRHNNLLLFELKSEVDSDLHEVCAEYLIDRLGNHSAKLERRTGLSRLLKLHAAKRRYGGTPDVLCRQAWNRRKHHLVNVIAEASYGVPLRLTHPRIMNYFAEYPTLRTALIIRIEYPWRRYPIGHEHEDFFDISNGKMILFRYDHPHFDRPSSAVSFGNDPITDIDIASFENDTGIDINNISGFGVGQAPACDAANIPLYQVLIDRDVLFMDHNDENDEGGNVLPVSMRDHLINALGENANELDLNIDLFLLKRVAIEDGIDSMNENIEDTVGLARPLIP